MKKIAVLMVLLVIVVFAMPAYADPKPKDVNVVNTPLPVTSGEYRFVGYSTDTTDGRPGGGIAGMHAICQESYGSTARMCTTKDYMLSPTATPPTSFALRAWIQPLIQGIVIEGDVLLTLDWSGAYKYNSWPRTDAPASANCMGWAWDSEERTGMVLTNEGVPSWFGLCSDELRVTCCDAQ